MGHHYTPQAHLKRFEIEEKPESVWMYDKKTSIFKNIHMSRVAQEADYYPPDVEDDLNLLVEIPGGRCIKKLLNQEHLNPQERHEMSVYLFTMRSRGPRQRRKAQIIANNALPETFNEMRQLFLNIKNQANTKEEVQKAIKKLSELDQLEKEWIAKPPEDYDRMVKTPHVSASTIDSINQMTWEVLPVTPHMHFITSDTPAHYFEDLGLGDAECQFTFTITKSWALVGHYRGDPRSTRFYQPINSQMTKEINRRIVSTTERFVFSSKKERWIELTAQKPEPFLSLIRF